MYAVIRSGGSQHRVQEGELLRVQKLDVPEGEQLTLDQVLLVSDGTRTVLGTPLVAGAAVTAEVVRQGRARRIRIIKMKRRKHHLRRQGHRQPYTELRITGIHAALTEPADGA